MNIHEYQAKEVLRQYGVATGKGSPAFTVEEAVKAAQGQPGPVWVVKAQIHAGGRGKGGGVKVVKSIDEVKAEAMRMLGMNLVTHQTGPGWPCAALTASSTVKAGEPLPVATPYWRKTSLA